MNEVQKLTDVLTECYNSLMAKETFKPGDMVTWKPSPDQV